MEDTVEVEVRGDIFWGRGVSLYWFDCEDGSVLACQVSREADDDGEDDILYVPEVAQGTDRDPRGTGRPAEQFVGKNLWKVFEGYLPTRDDEDGWGQLSLKRERELEALEKEGLR